MFLWAFQFIFHISIEKPSTTMLSNAMLITWTRKEFKESWWMESLVKELAFGLKSASIWLRNGWKCAASTESQWCSALPVQSPKCMSWPNMLRKSASTVSFCFRIFSTSQESKKIWLSTSRTLSSTAQRVQFTTTTSLNIPKWTVSDGHFFFFLFGKSIKL